MTWKQIGNKEGATRDPSKVLGMKRKTIIYWLPYWKVSEFCVFSRGNDCDATYYFAQRVVGPL